MSMESRLSTGVYLYYQFNAFCCLRSSRIDAPGGSTHHSALTKLVARRILFAQAIAMIAHLLILFQQLLTRDAFPQFRSHSHSYSYFATSNKDLNLEALR
jgi:hypothetical protein